jgi:hypothetical protein
MRDFTLLLLARAAIDARVQHLGDYLMVRRPARRHRASLRLVPGTIPLEVRLLPSSDVLTYHEDNTRSGWDSNETTLNPINVSPSSFGKLFNMPVDGKVDAQPLYVAGVTIPGQGVHNVLYVATENDSVYAFDADSGAPLWRVSMLLAGEVPSDPVIEVEPEIGITATPVIDPTTGTMYLVAMSRSFSGSTTVHHQRIHAISIATGADVVPPRSIDSSIIYPGTGPGGNGSFVAFDPMQYKERDALLLSNGVVYTSWASNSDTPPYTGWVIAFNASNLGLAYVLNIDPNGPPNDTFLDDGSGNSFWNSGDGPAADAAGNLYNISANGPFDTTLDDAGFPSGGDYGDSFVRMTPANGVLTVTDYFTPADQQILAAGDLDLGSSGIALADEPGPNGTIEHLAVGSDKQGDVFVVNRDNMGKYNTTGDFILQELPGDLGNGEFGAPAVFGGIVYFGAVGEPIRMFSFVNGVLVPNGQTTNSFGYPGSTPTVSSNGIINGILWATENGPNAVLHAYLATNPSIELYNSNMAADGRDWFGIGNKFITPVVANGKVYVATTAGVAAFGVLLTPPPILAQPAHASASTITGNQVPLGVLGADPSYLEADLLYAWGAILTPPGATLTFSANFSNAAKSTVATVSAPGTYIFIVYLIDPTGTQTECITVVNVVGASPSLVRGSTPALARPSASVAPTSAPSARVAAPAGASVLALAPASAAPPTAMASVDGGTMSAASSLGAGKITVVPQGRTPEAPAFPSPRPLGERRPSARSPIRWWSAW